MAPVRQAPSPKKLAAPVRPRPEVSVGPAPQRPSPSPQRAQTVFSAPIGTVHPAGGSATQRTARVNTRNQGYRQQIIATRQIQQRQEPRVLSNPRQDLAAVQRRATQQQQADVRAQHIAAQQVHMVQDQNPNPAKANRILHGQAYSQIKQASDIGRLTKIATTTSNPLQHRVGALRALRSRYGIPVTQQNFKAFRQAQAFHEFLHTGTEGQTITLPTAQTGGLRKTSQTYQLRKVNGQVVPVAVDQQRILSLGGLLSGHPYKDQYVQSVTAHDAIAAQSGGIARGFTQAGIDTAHFGAKLIPDGTVGTPVKRAITDLAALGPNTITGLYGLGVAGVQAATGNTKPIRGLAKSFAENDPLGRLIVHHDLKGVAAHPGIALAEAFGGVKAVDNLAGRVDRGGGVFSRPQAPGIRDYRSAPLTRLARQDRYSKGYVTSRVQAARDAKIVAKYQDLRTQAVAEATKGQAAQAAGDHATAAGHMKAAHGLAAQAERFNLNRMREGHNLQGPRRNAIGASDLQKLYDVTEGTNNAAQRAGRTEGLRQMVGQRAVREKNRQAPVVLKGAQGEVQGLIAEMRVAPNRAELTKLRDRLSTQQQFLKDHHEAVTNRHIVSALTEVLKTHTDQQIKLLGDEARRYARVNVGMHQEAINAKVLNPDEARMSALKPFAVEQMKAVPNAEGKLVIHRTAPADVSHWEHMVRVARDDLNRARIREGGAAPVEIRTKQRALKAAVDRLKVERAKGPVAVEHILSASDIEKAAHAYADKHPGAMRPGEQAFISHSSRISGPGSFNIRSDTAKGLSRARRTGAAVLYGTASVGREAMLGSAIKLRNMVSHAESWRHFLTQASARDPARIDHATGNAGPIQANSGAEALTRFNHLMTDQTTKLPVPGAYEGVAVRMNPLGGRPEQLAETLHQIDAEGFLPGNDHPILDAQRSALEAALKGDHSAPGVYTVIPKETAARALEHAKVASGSVAFLRSVSQAFRHTVLPFSPTWLTGNAIESLGRSAVAGWRPQDTQLERNAVAELAKLDPVQAKRLVLGIGHGHLGSVRNWQVKTTANSLEGGLLKPIRQVGEAILAAPKIGKKVEWGTHAIQGYTDWMMNSVNGAMEDAIKRGMVGTQMRHLFLPPDLAKITVEAARAVAGELHSNPAAVDELIRAVQRAYGSYEHFTPEIRKTLLNYTPFGAWTLNATNFLFRVLPADHPGLVALAAATSSATQQYRRDNGLDATLAQEKGAGQKPPFLMGSIPTPAWYAHLVGAQPGAPLRLARYTPLGIATDPMSTVASAFIPQLPLEALQGLDFTGRQLRNKDGSSYDDSQKLGYFVQAFAMGTIPLFGQIVRGIQKGPLAVVNPAQPVANKATTKGKSAWGAAAGTASSGGWGAAAGTAKSSSGWGG
jgi:hypothetical protein